MMEDNLTSLTAIALMAGLQNEQGLAPNDRFDLGRSISDRSNIFTVATNTLRPTSEKISSGF